MTARRATALRRWFTGSPGTPPFAPERTVSGPNPRESPGTRGDRKARVEPSCGRFPCKLEDLQPEVDRLTRERSLARTQPRPSRESPATTGFDATPRPRHATRQTAVLRSGLSRAVPDGTVSPPGRCGRAAAARVCGRAPGARG